jgi:hypothetical protein
MSVPSVVLGGGVFSCSGFSGNCTKVTFAPKIEVAKYADYSTGVKRWGKIRASFRGFTGMFVTDYITGGNLALFIAGMTGTSLASASFSGVTADGRSSSYTFTNVAITPGGETDLINFDKFQEVPFAFEGTMTMPSGGGV